MSSCPTCSQKLDKGDIVATYWLSHNPKTTVDVCKRCRFKTNHYLNSKPQTPTIQGLKAFIPKVQYQDFFA